MENAAEFYEDFTKEIQEQPEIILDFSKIRFIDSSGVGMLLKSVSLLRAKKAILSICGLNRALVSVFKLAGLMKIFKVLEFEEAVQRFPELQD